MSKAIMKIAQLFVYLKQYYFTIAIIILPVHKIRANPMIKRTKIILASSSTYRQRLLQQLQLDFSCESPDIDENHLPNESATELVLRLAEQKAATVAEKHRHTNTFIIGSDQVAAIEGDILTKPHTHEKAVQQLSLCSAKTVTFHTGLSLFDCNSMTATTLCEDFNVTFRALTPQQIDNYLLREQPYDCAGSFKMEGLGISLFSKLQGNDPNTLIGLPLITLNRLLFEAGIDILTHTSPTETNNPLSDAN